MKGMAPSPAVNHLFHVAYVNTTDPKMLEKCGQVAVSLEEGLARDSNKCHIPVY
jgi:hypothetical protein